MLALVDPARLPDVLEVCRRWGILASVLGEMTTGGSLGAVPGRGGGRGAGGQLADDGPVYSPARPAGPAGPGAEVPWTRTRPRPCSPWPPTRPARPSAGCGSSTTASWATGPWPGPAPTRPCSGPRRGQVALATDGNGRYAALDPAAGAALAVAEAARNVACTGAQPIAVTNCLNFASPERPEVMGVRGHRRRGPPPAAPSACP